MFKYKNLNKKIQIGKIKNMLEQNFENRNILNHGGGRSAVANPFREGPSFSQHSPQDRREMQQA